MSKRGDYPGLDYNVRKRVSRYPWGRLSEIVVSADQADLMGDGLANELTQGFLAHIPDNASNHISLATAAFVLVPVPSFSADESLIDFHDTHKLLEVLIGQASANAMAHIPSRLVRTEPHVAHDLKCADALVAGEHQMDDFEPAQKVNVRVLEHRPDQHRKTITTSLCASRALPVEGAGMGMDVDVAAARADHAIGPAMGNQIRLAGVLIREHGVELGGGELVNSLASHGCPPSLGGRWHV